VTEVPPQRFVNRPAPGGSRIETVHGLKLVDLVNRGSSAGIGTAG
jgi:hypothetical protein